MTARDDIRADLIGSRRTFILRLLVEVEGYVLESVLTKHILKAFPTASREDVQQDLAHLITNGCLAEKWTATPDGGRSIRNLVLTPRGEDAAFGRLEVPGVWRSRWDRG